MTQCLQGMPLMHKQVAFSHLTSEIAQAACNHMMLHQVTPITVIYLPVKLL